MTYERYKDKERRKKYMSDYGKINRKKLNKYNINYYHKANGKEYVKKWYHDNIIEIRRKKREQVKKNRLKILIFLGKKCIKCGNTDWRVLQVDHINGNGSKDRKTYGHSPSALFNDIMKNKNKYQLLCANCNWIKRYENKEQFNYWKGKRLYE